MYYIFFISMLICSKTQDKGHNLRNIEKIIVNGMNKTDIIDQFGKPLQFNKDENIIYYVNSIIENNNIFSNKLLDGMIVRLKFNDSDELIDVKYIKFQNYSKDINQTPYPKAIKNELFQSDINFNLVS